MFRKLTKALEPFGLSIILLAGLSLTGRLPITDHVILGYVTIFVGASLIVVHVADQMSNNPNSKSKKG